MRCVITDEQVGSIVRFIDEHRDVDTLLIHCYAGMSRSLAVGLYVAEVTGGKLVTENTGSSENDYVYRKLVEAAEV